jgi:ribosome-associated protein
MNADQLKDLAVNALEDLKGHDILVLDVRTMTGMTDYMVFCTGNSNRQVKSLANNVAVEAKKAGQKMLGTEGEQDGEWVLVDMGDVIVHVMLAETRAFYDLERLWAPAADSQQTH